MLGKIPPTGSCRMVRILSTRGNACLVKSHQRKLGVGSDPFYREATSFTPARKARGRGSSVGLIVMI